jgi:hypothetical protein
MRLYSIMIELITFHNDRKYCGRSQAIAGVIIDHLISQNSLMIAVGKLDAMCADRGRKGLTGGIPTLQYMGYKYSLYKSMTGRFRPKRPYPSRTQNCRGCIHIKIQWHHFTRLIYR